MGVSLRGKNSTTASSFAEPITPVYVREAKLQKMRFKRR